MTIKFLISSIGGDLAQSVARCLRDEFKGAKLIGLDAHLEHSGMYFVDEFHPLEHATNENYLTSLYSILIKEKPEFFFPLSETELAKLAILDSSELESLLGETQLIWSGAQTLKIFQKKNLTLYSLYCY